MLPDKASSVSYCFIPEIDIKPVEMKLRQTVLTFLHVYMPYILSGLPYCCKYTRLWVTENLLK
ncbi:hypothetical protein SAMN05216403_11034 [Nitrosospira multiformis ATCC 25196]|uniref:Uncharacterized protein n=1 Tax=Nitrosospira multiformis (strain ATCC 25196 / NCIMB 11849 / C 71) TaxID=323848 RepID=A0A1H5V1K0_NITMU|nr:hypothetical protein SAMN05216411_101357 [Nitrosospira multiformis]SEF81255.1 hypothetical protein SAMN05216403_11034 [Nitrosospira multiformis ATCC 25196]